MVKNYFHNVIRLRKGKSNLSQVYWLIVILNKNKTSSHKQVEQLGFFKHGKEKLFSVNYQRLAYYLNKGFKLKNSIKKYIYWHSIIFNKYYKFNKFNKLKKYYKLLFNKKKRNAKGFKKINALKCYYKYYEIATKLMEKAKKRQEKRRALALKIKIEKYKKKNKNNKGLFYKNRNLFFKRFYRDNPIKPPKKLRINFKKINLKDVFSY